jgi:predicted transcriptional regulator/transcriptional regulator with XRE-family HTH domain
MTSNKIFAGSRLRRLRLKLGFSQSAFAQSLGLSASYLNLMERDQRPLTAQVVLKLSAMEGVDVAELSGGDAAHVLLQPLREMVADPLLLGEVPPGNELRDAVQSAPNFASAAVKLYAAYREVLRNLANVAREFPQVPAETKVEDWGGGRNNNDLEGLAEDIWSELSPKDDIFSGLKARLRSSFGIDTRILPTTILNNDRSRYDRHSQRLMISETLDFEQRIMEAAHLVARLEGREIVDAAAAMSPFNDRPDQQRLAKAALLHHLALAILCPRGRFSASAEDLKFDIESLARRFSVTKAKAMQRVSQLNSEIGFLGVGANGDISSRIGNLHFFLPEDAPLCGQLPLFDEEKGFHSAEMQPQEGSPLYVLALREPGSAFALFFTAEDFAKSAYAQKPMQRPNASRNLGATCRLCEVSHCARRSAASVTRPAGLNDYIRGTTDFEPV